MDTLDDVRDAFWAYLHKVKRVNTGLGSTSDVGPPPNCYRAIAILAETIAELSAQLHGHHLAATAPGRTDVGHDG